MIEIIEITNDYKQELFPVLSTGETFKFNLEFCEMEACWYASIKFGNVEINNIRLCLSDNILYSWKNILPFGLMLVAQGAIKQQLDPFLLNDFASGRVKVFILNESEVAEFDAL